MKPAANMDATSFEWPLPKLHRVRAYCREQLGWTEVEMDQQVDTVIERYANRSQQVRWSSDVAFVYSYHTLPHLVPLLLLHGPRYALLYLEVSSKIHRIHISILISD